MDFWRNRLRSTGAFQTSPGGLLLGYKVMAWDTESKRLLSGANRRLQLPLRYGAVHTMPGDGIFLAASADYVLMHYAVHNTNALLTYEFDPKNVTRGSLTDREPEIAVSSARLLDHSLFDGED